MEGIPNPPPADHRVPAPCLDAAATDGPLYNVSDSVVKYVIRHGAARPRGVRKHTTRQVGTEAYRTSAYINIQGILYITNTGQMGPDEPQYAPRDVWPQ